MSGMMTPSPSSASPVVVVTGASAGVGRATVLRFAREGARLGLIARSEAALRDTAREVEALGGEALVLPLDVADAAAVFDAADRVEARFGPIDVWVNDAMATVFSPVADITPEEFRRVTEVTYLGFVHGTMAALRHMRPQGRGAIVQVGSALAFRGIPLQSAYCGAKHAIRGFTSSLRAELDGEGSRIHVSMVELPAVNTPQFDWARTHLSSKPRPMGKPIRPEVAADAIFRASQGRWREYWLGLPTVETILGNFLLPGVLDRYLGRTAFEGQETGEPLPPDRRDNLDAAVPGLHRVAGSFSDEASGRALVVPGPVARLGGAALGAAALFALGLAVAGTQLTRRR
jgi:NAD(P)-dependent dehydrogenase (short-subunit alcohol dehydrogenase family)